MKVQVLHWDLEQGNDSGANGVEGGRVLHD